MTANPPRYITDHEDEPQHATLWASPYCARCGAENHHHTSWAHAVAETAGGTWEDYIKPLPKGSTYRPIQPSPTV